MTRNATFFHLAHHAVFHFFVVSLCPNVTTQFHFKMCIKIDYMGYTEYIYDNQNTNIFIIRLSATLFCTTKMPISVNMLYSWLMTIYQAFCWPHMYDVLSITYPRFLLQNNVIQQTHDGHAFPEANRPHRGAFGRRMALS